MKTRKQILGMAVAAALVTGLSPAADTLAGQITPEEQIRSVFQNGSHQQQAERAAIEVVFVLDTTGSMSGMIEAAKEKIWAIASSLARAENQPDIRMGLVAYRDRGDRYVTRITPLSDDLDAVYSALMQFQAQGGGDTPESVNQALQEAVTKISWSRHDHTYKALFLVGDAPPHMDYAQDLPYTESVTLARAKGIFVNAIQCGNAYDTRRIWQQIARMGGGEYFQVAQNGAALAIATPYDKEMARLARQLDETRLFYGEQSKREALKSKASVSEKLYEEASPSALARRAEFQTSKSGKKNFTAESELVEDVSAGKVALDAVDESLLPDALRPLSPAERQAVVSGKARERAEIEKKLKDLAEKRQAFLRDAVAKKENAGTSLDKQLYSTLRKQAKEKGLEYRESDERY